MPDPALLSGGRWAATHSDKTGLGEWRIPLKNPPKLGPETNWTYFPPSRVDSRPAPAWFLEKLHEIDPRLSCNWHPVRERWVIWFREDNKWRMIMPWANPYRDWAYLPLDERCLANVWDRCGRVHGSGLKYWERIEAEVWRDIAARDKARHDLVNDVSGDYYDYRQIKNIGQGNKFATSHSD